MSNTKELEKLRVGCERGNLKSISATEALALFNELDAARARIAEREADNASLREAIGDAPHATDCDRWVFDDEGGFETPFPKSKVPCTCWKRDVLKEEK